MNISLFHPYVNEAMRKAVDETLQTKWIGQGPKVDQFERDFSLKFGEPYCIAMNSGSSALETAYELAHIKSGDEIICTPLTCTATHIPLLRMGAKLVFADIRKDTLTIDFEDVQKRFTHKTKAIIQVHLGGIRCPLSREMALWIEESNISLITDACQALGFFDGNFTCISFQAIKIITTGDGGMLTVNNQQDYQKAKLMRWFGIDREKKRVQDWQAYKEREMVFDIEMLGYKRQPTDIMAAMGLEGLKVYDDLIKYRKILFDIYKETIDKIDGITLIDGEQNVHWLATILVENRDAFVRMMTANGIETNLVQVRNDAYKIFGGRRKDLPNMDWVESRYVSIPLHNYLKLEEIEFICECIKKGW